MYLGTLLRGLLFPGIVYNAGTLLRGILFPGIVYNVW